MNKIIFVITIILLLSFSNTLAQEKVNSAAIGITPAIMEHVAVQGKEYITNLVIFNNTKFPLPIKGTIENFIVNEPLFDQSTEAQEIFDASSWITIEPADFILQPDEEKEIQITLNTPLNAEPGGHYATIFFQPLIPTDFISQYSAYITAKVGSLVFLVTPGNIIEKASIELFSTKKFYVTGPVNFDLSIRNEGNIHILPSGEVEIKNIFNKTVTTLNPKPHTVLPNTARSHQFSWDKKYPVGRFKAVLKYHYGSDTVFFEDKEVIFWVFPYHIALPVIIILTILLWLITIRRRQLILALKILFKKQGGELE